MRTETLLVNVLSHDLIPFTKQLNMMKRMCHAPVMFSLLLKWYIFFVQLISKSNMNIHFSSTVVIHP